MVIRQTCYCEGFYMATGWATPDYTKSRIATAGRRIRKGEPTAEDWEVVENWRRAHAYVLNTFQMRLRSTRNRFGGEVQVAQRHKRRPTIVDKLLREPSMQLSTMHDIAGCRAICSSIEELLRFREMFLDTRSKHVHLNRDDDRFNYIEHPKSSGYRGIHDVFETNLESESGQPWNGLKVEIQFRTRAQHAWATAVETVDLLNGDRAKFGQASPELQRFFVVSSELIARYAENRKGYLTDLSDVEVATEFGRLNRELGIVRRLSDAVTRSPEIRKDRNTILIFHFDGEQRLEILSFDSITPAQRAYSELEERMEGRADVVLVKAQHVDDLRRAFQNYFTDAREFVELTTTAYENMR
jgi:putative GTP pyrophosphokinase